MKSNLPKLKYYYVGKAKDFMINVVNEDKKRTCHSLPTAKVATKKSLINYSILKVPQTSVLELLN